MNVQLFPIEHPTQTVLYSATRVSLTLTQVILETSDGPVVLERDRYRQIDIDTHPGDLF